jgi:hypothetical protein
MKLIQSVLLCLAASNAVKAETLDEALAKARARWEQQQQKKTIRTKIKSKYQLQILKLRQAQQEETLAELLKTEGGVKQQ